MSTIQVKEEQIYAETMNEEIPTVYTQEEPVVSDEEGDVKRVCCRCIPIPEAIRIATMLACLEKKFRRSDRKKNHPFYKNGQGDPCDFMFGFKPFYAFSFQMWQLLPIRKDGMHPDFNICYLFNMYDLIKGYPRFFVNSGDISRYQAEEDFDIRRANGSYGLLSRFEIGRHFYHPFEILERSLICALETEEDARLFISLQYYPKEPTMYPTQQHSLEMRKFVHCKRLLEAFYAFAGVDMSAPFTESYEILKTKSKEWSEHLAKHEMNPHRFLKDMASLEVLPWDSPYLTMLFPSSKCVVKARSAQIPQEEIQK